MNCIIIDDEPLAIDVIHSYCETIGNINVIEIFSSGLEALHFLNQNHKIDLIFCDIEMPNFSGLDFIKTLNNRVPFLIFTTAYPEYALESYELNITDYLVKPIPFARFVKAIDKVKELKKIRDKKVNINIVPAGSEKNKIDDFIFVKSEYENIKLNLSNILYIKGLKDYLKICIKDQKSILTLMNFNEMQKKLPKNGFLRVHRSFIINIDKIKSIQKNKILIEEERIPIGESYKDEVYKRFGL